MISEGSCDTEDWSNDAENFHRWNELLFNYIKKHKSVRDFFKIITRIYIIKKKRLISFLYTQCVHNQSTLTVISLLNKGLTPPSSLPTGPFSRTVLKTASKSLGKTGKALEAQEVLKKKHVSISFLLLTSVSR